jgi:Gaa1-like, GPI transamidase component
MLLTSRHEGNTYWSKDIIILITDESVRGMQAWLNAYHGVNFGSKFVTLRRIFAYLPMTQTL